MYVRPRIVSSVQKRLLEYEDKHDLNSSELAAKAGIPQQTLSRYELGQRMPKIDIVQNIASALDVNFMWLVGYDVPMKDTVDEIKPVDVQRVPILGDIACGEPILAIESFESYIQCGAHIKCDFCLRAKGDSMTGARIYDGDIVFIRKQSTVQNGEIAAVLIDDEATLKRVYIRDDSIRLEPENPKYRPLLFIGEQRNSIRILGKAVAFQADVI
jgi:repressor LexA